MPLPELERNLLQLYRVAEPQGRAMLLQQMPRLDSEVASVVPGLGLGLGLGARLALGGLCAVRGVAGRMLLQAGVLVRMEDVVQVGAWYA